MSARYFTQTWKKKAALGHSTRISMVEILWRIIFGKESSAFEFIWATMSLRRWACAFFLIIHKSLEVDQWKCRQESMNELHQLSLLPLFTETLNLSLGYGHVLYCKHGNVISCDKISLKSAEPNTVSSAIYCLPRFYDTKIPWLLEGNLFLDWEKAGD